MSLRKKSLVFPCQRYTHSLRRDHIAITTSLCNGIQDGELSAVTAVAYRNNMIAVGHQNGTLNIWGGECNNITMCIIG